jgi:opine dehydrogenase
MKRKIAILGAGNGGQAFAAYFKYHGHEVKLYDVFQDTVDAINKKGFIELTGALEAKIDFAQASTDMGKVVAGAEMIMIINPSTHHRKIAAELAKHLRKDQIIFINPGATFGSFAFKKALTDNGYTDELLSREQCTVVCLSILRGGQGIGRRNEGQNSRLRLPGEQTEGY